MSESSPWDSISTPDTDFNVLQVAGDRPVKCYWGKDDRDSCLFIVELHGDFTEEFRRTRVVLKGISMDLRSGGGELQRLVLALDRQVDRDLFEGLCQTLVTALGFASDSTTALTLTVAHLKRWKLFLAGSSGQVLSQESIQGLFAELVFLRELIGKAGSDYAVEAWLGPERSHQDFIFGDTAVEIKSLSGAERSEVNISSEDQLETLKGNLFLRVYRLSSLIRAEGSISINDLVLAIQGELDSAESSNLFGRKLIAQGYAPLPDYDEPKFCVSEIRTFKILNGFPRLIRSEIPVGTKKLSYCIRLEAMESFRVDNDSALGEA